MSFRINTNATAMTALRNLGQTGQAFGQTVNRLSTGLRIVSAADDPAGLISSENFRAQIGGITQAIRNNEDAINYAKTAEGALDEVSRLLREGRSLAVASANSAVLSADQLQANQTQWNLIVNSINRIANETQFGTRKLLNGSAGVTAAVVNSTAINSISLSGTFNGAPVVASGAVGINVTTAATKATFTGTANTAAASQAAYLAATTGENGTFYVNGIGIDYRATDTWQEVITKINLQSANTGVTADSVFGGGVGNIRLTATKYGTTGNFTLSDPGLILGAAGTQSATGINSAATVTIGGVNVNFTGGAMGNDGLTLTDTDGNIVRLQEGVGTGAVTNPAFVNVGSAQFQTGGNANQRATLSLGNFTAASLLITGLDMTNSTGATASISAIDGAINSLSRKRGEIGSFMRNVLESNVRSLSVAKENLSSTESMIRDADMAEEMTVYTRLQILQQSGLSVLAQANSAPQAVLSLLRG